MKVELNTITITLTLICYIVKKQMVPDFVRFTPDRWKSKMYLRLLVLLYSKETDGTGFCTFYSRQVEIKNVSEIIGLVI